MKKLFLLFWAVAAGYASQAQTIPGADMENWRSSTTGIGAPLTVQAPVSWYGADSLIIGLGQMYSGLLMLPDSVFRRNLFREDVIVHSGSHSAKVMTVLQDTLLIPGVLSTGHSNVQITFIPKPGISGVTLTGGDAVTVKPKTVSAWVQYYPGNDGSGTPGIDSAIMTVQALSRIGGKDSVIGSGTITIGPSATWVQVTDSIFYPLDSTGTIDTMRISFFSSKTATALDSSTLYVDDVSMTSVTNPDHTGFENLTISGPVMVYPNPANNTIYFSSSMSQRINVLLYTLSGRQVTETQLTGANTLDISYLPDGLYFYTIIGADGNVLQRGKVAIAR